MKPIHRLTRSDIEEIVFNAADNGQEVTTSYYTFTYDEQRDLWNGEKPGTRICKGESILEITTDEVVDYIFDTLL